MVIALFIFGLFSLLLAQFFRIQIVEGEKWTREANKQHLLIVKEPFKRGRFISNSSIKEGHPETPLSFVVDIQKFHLHIDPESIPESNKIEVSSQLQKMLSLTAGEQLSFQDQFFRRSRNRRIAMWLDESSKEAVLDWWNPYARRHKLARNALFFVSDYQRSYPFGKLLGQLLHTVQNVKETETNQAIPTGGLELYFKDVLKGKGGKRRLMRSPRNNFEMGEVIAYPEDGADVYLTINHCLQAIAEEELAKGVKKVKAKSGWAVMMDPYTGEILALAQYPFFLPPDYQLFFKDPLLIEHTKVKAVTDANEPGSIMKPITIAIALKANDELVRRGERPLFDPEERMPTSASHFPGRSKPLKDTHLHYFLNMEMAIMKSSNIYVARLVERIIQRLGNEWYRNALTEFGFGDKTGIELPSESRGVLPKPGNKHPNGTLEWSQATPYSMAMGHNIQVNTLQAVRAFSVFANGGFLVKPTLVRKIVRTNANGQQEVLVDHTVAERTAQFPLILSEGIVKKVVRALKYTTKRGGTASRADVWGYTECGKTGTGNKVIKGAYSDYHVCSTYIGFTPMSRPRFVLAVVMDEPEYGYIPGIGKNHHGGTCSAPVFREIAKRSLEYLGISPDDPYGYPPGDPRYDPTKADWVAEAKRLQELYDKWNAPNQ